jgi:hypoxanthine phosphoribosyltransferase
MISMTANILYQVKELFESKEWKIEEHERSVFNKFCNMLSFLTDDQKDLILNLSKNYLRINFKEYEHHLIMALDKFCSNLSKQIKHIYVFPVKLQEDIGKNKGSDVIIRFFYDPDIESYKKLANIKIYKCDVIDSIPKNFNTDDSSTILIVDDFVGTGETVNRFIEIFKTNNIDISRISILSLVIHSFGLKTLSNITANIYYSVLIKRGITDLLQDNCNKFLKIMEEIEDKIKVKSKFKSGYGKCEALISLIRTPNNTFPVYWYENKSVKNVVPFPRN